jgi:hypothetical protein
MSALKTVQTVKDEQLIVVWFSCGAASAVAAKKTLDRYGYSRVRIVNNPVLEEDRDNRRFLDDVQNWLGHPIEIASNEKFPSNSAVDVWEKRKYMSGVAGAPCTLVLKKEVRYVWERINKPDWHVLGFTYDEIGRYEKFIQTERPNTLPILIDAKLTKNECFDILKRHGLKLPNSYLLGYPNANCLGCVKATSPTYWNHVRNTHPEVFRQRAEQSRRIGVRLVRYKGERIFLDELPPDAKGAPMKSMNIECGIFCEEWKPDPMEIK